jgi:hypothetical protein
MRWTNRSTLVTPAFVERVRLRRAALRYAEHGWAVTPGACLSGDRFTCGRLGCPIMGCHPALAEWAAAASTDAARIGAWWDRLPHTVLLATGGAFDVLEVPAALGLRVLEAARTHTAAPDRTDASGPVAVTPTGRWMFLVRPGEALRTELDNYLDMVLHGPGSWIPAAPTRTPEGPVRWAVPPEQTRWQLPAAAVVQALLVDALGSLGRPPRTVAVPRQISTGRRAA